MRFNNSLSDITRWIVVIGAEQSGKSALVNSFLKIEFTPTYKVTIGAELYTPHITVDDKSCSLMIMEVAGSPECAFLIQAYSAKNIIFICLPLAGENILELAKHYVELVKPRLTQSSVIAFVLTKIDEGNDADVAKIIKALHAIYPSYSCYPTSAKTRHGVDKLFKSVVRDTLPKRVIQLTSRGEFYSIESEEPPGSYAIALRIYINNQKVPLIRHREKTMPDYERLLEILNAYKMVKVCVSAGADYSQHNYDYRHPCAYEKEQQTELLKFLLKLAQLKPELTEIVLPYDPATLSRWRANTKLWQRIQTVLKTKPSSNSDKPREISYYQESTEMRLFTSSSSETKSEEKPHHLSPDGNHFFTLLK